MVFIILKVEPEEAINCQCLLCPARHRHSDHCTFFVPQTIKINLTRENDFVRENMVTLIDQMRRYENHSDIMIGIKKEISSLNNQLLQKDTASLDSKAQVRLLKLTQALPDDTYLRS